MEMPDVFKCPYCGSKDTRLNGTRFYGKPKQLHQTMKCYGCHKSFNLTVTGDVELAINNFKLRKKNQQLEDTNRIERKSLREHIRIDNGLEEYTKHIIRLLQDYDFKEVCKVHTSKESKAVGIVHLSDLHFNELVDVVNNKYDFKVAAKRLQLFAEEAITYLKAAKVTNILIADTGDKLNSDRRMDEYLNQATNRSNATMLAVHLLKQFILHLAEHFNITYACVTGNESRVKDEPGYSNIIATDNYDFTIFNILRYMFASSPVEFIIGDPSELIIEVNGQNVLLLHGNTVRGDVTKVITGIKGKYADKGILIDYIIFGDIHETRISDNFSRSGSMVGDNAYSFLGLHLTGRAGQNIHVFKKNKNRNSFKIDLQNINGVEGYDIKEELEAYNAKSSQKLHKSTVIFQIVV